MPLRPAPLPPRAALPRDIVIPRLPGLGVTWYERGPRYWARRLRMSLLWALVLALVAAFDIGLVTAIRQSSQTGFAVFLVADVTLTAVLLAWYAVRTVRLWNTAALPGQDGRSLRPSRRAGGPAGQLAQLGYLVAVPLLAVVFLLFPGIFVLLFLASLLPEPATERHARLWMAQLLRERGYQAPAA